MNVPDFPSQSFKRRQQHRHARRVAGAVLLAGLGLTALEAGLAWREAAARQAQTADAAAQRRVAHLRHAVEAYLVPTRLLVNTLGPMDALGANDLRRFITALEAPRDFPALEGVLVAVQVRTQDWPALRARLRQQADEHPEPRMAAALRQIELWPAGSSTDHLVTVLAEPGNANYEEAVRAIGYDLNHDPQRLTATLLARDSGQPQLLPPFARDPAQPLRINALAIRSPIYRTGAPLDTLAQRRTAFVGVASAVLDLPKLLQQVESRFSDDLHMQWRILDLGPSEAAATAWMDEGPRVVRQVHDSRAGDTGLAIDQPLSADTGSQRRTERLDLVGRRWEVSTRVDLDPPWFAIHPWAVLLLGSLLSVAAARAMLHWRQRVIVTETDLAQVDLVARRNAETLRSVLSSASQAILSVDAQGQVIDLNDRARDLLGIGGAPAGETPPLAMLLPGLTLAEDAQTLRLEPREGQVSIGNVIESTLVSRCGRRRPVAVSWGDMHIDGEPRLTLVITDLSRQSDANEHARRSESLAQALLASPLLAVVVLGPDGTISGLNPAAERMTGYTAQDLAGQTLAALQVPGEAAMSAAPGFASSGPGPAALTSAEADTTRVDVQVWHHKEGRTLDVRLSRTALGPRNAEAMAHLLVVEDITERKRQAELNQRLASVDPVTGLRHRAAFEHLLDEAVARSHAGGKPAGLLLLSLQSNGPATNGGAALTLPDSVLQETARRLRTHLRSNDVIGRLGASDFGVLLSGLASQQGADVVLDKLGRLLVPMLAEAVARDLPVQARWGLAWGLEAGEQASDLLSRADRASRPLMPTLTGTDAGPASDPAPRTTDTPSTAGA